MTTFKPGDRVIVTIDGHDTEWTVRHVFYSPGLSVGCLIVEVDRLIVERDQISMNLPHEMVRPAPMEEPTEIGDRVVILEGITLTRFAGDERHTRWITESGKQWPWKEVARHNPRPYTGGDDD